MKKILIYVTLIIIGFLISLFLIWIYNWFDEKRSCMYIYIEKYDEWSIYYDRNYNVYHIDQKWLENLDRYKKINDMDLCNPEDLNIISVVNFFYCYIIKFIKKTWIHE